MHGNASPEIHCAGDEDILLGLSVRRHQRIPLTEITDSPPVLMGRAIVIQILHLGGQLPLPAGFLGVGHAQLIDIQRLGKSLGLDGDKALLSPRGGRLKRHLGGFFDADRLIRQIHTVQIDRHRLTSVKCLYVVAGETRMTELRRHLIGEILLRTQVARLHQGEGRIRLTFCCCQPSRLQSDSSSGALPSDTTS